MKAEGWPLPIGVEAALAATEELERSLELSRVGGGVVENKAAEGEAGGGNGDVDNAAAFPPVCL